MSPPKGNKFWEARSSHGRTPIFSDTDSLRDACHQYFEWVYENPLMEIKPFHNQGEVIQEPIPLMRAMTIQGLCNYIGVSHDTWARYRKKDDLCEVVKEIEGIMYDQKFSGAAAGLLNSNIIARDLGLKDSSERDVKVNIAEQILSELDETDGLPSSAS